jgi:hypothetical protein
VAHPVEKVNGLLRGLYLNRPGDYQITLVYQPSSVIWGRWVSGISLLLLILGLILTYRQAKSTDEPALVREEE